MTSSRTQQQQNRFSHFIVQSLTTMAPEKLLQHHNRTYNGNNSPPTVLHGNGDDSPKKVESRYELAISHFQIPRQQAEAWAYSVPPPSSSVTAIRPAYTDDGYLIGPLNESSLYPQSSSRTGLGSSDMWAESFQYSLPSPDLGAEPSNYSTASGPSATSSAVESALSIHGHVVPVPEWAPQELGFEPSIVQYDNICSNGSNDYGSQQPTGIDDYVFDLIVSSMPSPIGRYKNGP